MGNDALGRAAFTLAADFESFARAVAVAFASPGAEARFQVQGDEKGEKSGSCVWRAATGRDGRPGIVARNFRTGAGFTVFDEQTPPQDVERIEKEAARRLAKDEEAKIELAKRIWAESVDVEPTGAARCYWRAKGMVGAPCARFAARRYDLPGGRGFLAAGTSIWPGRDGEGNAGGAVQCVQGKTWAGNRWFVLTVGPTSGAWVEVTPGPNTGRPPGCVFLAEGVSTAWGAFQVFKARRSGLRAFACLGKGNLEAAALRARSIWGERVPLYICADIDPDGGGEAAALEAADKSGADVLLPLLERTWRTGAGNAAFLKRHSGKVDFWDFWKFFGGVRQYETLKRPFCRVGKAAGNG